MNETIDAMARAMRRSMSDDPHDLRTRAALAYDAVKDLSDHEAGDDLLNATLSVLAQLAPNPHQQTTWTETANACVRYAEQRGISIEVPKRPALRKAS